MRQVARQSTWSAPGSFAVTWNIKTDDGVADGESRECFSHDLKK